MTFILNCDCSYASRNRLPFMSIREKGAYWIEDGVILFSRATGEITEWPYTFEDGDLILEESPTERHTYDRKSAYECF